MEENTNKKDKQAEDRPSGKNRKNPDAGSVASINSIINSPTDQVRSRRHTDTLSNTGADISYEGATAPGSGGSAGTGDSSGKDAVGARISTNDGYESVSGKNGSKEGKGEALTKPEKHDDSLDRGITGTP